MDKEANSREDSSDSTLDNPKSRSHRHTSWSLSVPPFPGPRRECTNGFCRAAPPPSAITLCAIQLEIDKVAPEIDVYFNRGKSLEDVFQSLRLDLPSWSDAKVSESIARVVKSAFGELESPTAFQLPIFLMLSFTTEHLESPSSLHPSRTTNL